MKIQIASDLHTEFHRPGDPYVLPKTDADVIVLAGDIGVGFDEEAVFCEDVTKEHGKDVVFVLGNHSFYQHSNVDKIRHAWSNASLPGVHYLDEGRSFIKDGVLFVGGILWTDFNDGNITDMWRAERDMNDYRSRMSYPDSRNNNKLIRKTDEFRFTAMRSVDEHRKIKAWIAKEIVDKREDVDKVVVVSHHLPSYKCIPQEFMSSHTSDMNPAYASHLDQWIEDMDAIDLWIHGHTHSSNDLYLNDRTRVVCNPRGYYKYEVNEEFDDSLVIEI